MNSHLRERKGGQFCVTVEEEEGSWRRCGLEPEALMLRDGGGGGGLKETVWASASRLYPHETLEKALKQTVYLNYVCFLFQQCYLVDKISVCACARACVCVYSYFAWYA